MQAEPRSAHAGAAEPVVRVSSGQEPSGSELRHGVLGAADITFMVVAVAAPMAVVVATLPLAFALGNGPGVAGTFVLVSIAMACLSAGYVRLVPLIPNAGAFYAIIGAAFGRLAALAAAYVALFSYLCLCCATLGALAYFSSDLSARVCGYGPPWPLLALVWLCLLTILSYYQITLTAHLLGAALVAEVAMIVALDGAILLAHGGHLPIAPILPGNVFAPGLGISAIYAFNSCIGFEGTAIYQEEARDPARTIPRATYTFIALIAVFYVLTAWCLATAAGVDTVGSEAARDPGHFVFGIAERYLGGWAEDGLSILVITSAFAAVLGLFNNTARYVFALARDGVLPRQLVHTTRHGAPFAAGLPVIGLLVVTVLGFALAGFDPLLSMATSLTGVGSVGLMTLLAITGFAIPVFFHRARQGGLAVLVLPTVGGVMTLLAAVLSVLNYESLTGSASLIVNRLPLALVAVALAGAAQAHWLRKQRPETYSRIGATAVSETA